MYQKMREYSSISKDAHSMQSKLSKILRSDSRKISKINEKFKSAHEQTHDTSKRDDDDAPNKDLSPVSQPLRRKN